MLGALVAVALIHGGAAAAQGMADPVWPTRQWETSTPEQQGMDSAALAKLLAFGAAHSFDSLLIARHGKIVLDANYAPYTADIPHVMNSTTKAVIGTLTAIAVNDGMLDSVDHPVLDFFRDRSIANLDDSKKAITIQNLLNMTSGFDWEEGIEGGREQSLMEFGRSPDHIQYVLNRPMLHAPGEVFNYNSGNPNLLSAIITKLTGKTARDYAVTKLFDRLGIAPPTWLSDGQGLSTGGGGLSLPPRDMAKLAYLYLRHGEWDGKQLMPPAWVDRINHATVNMHASFDPELRYSNFFWVFPDRHVFMAIGDRCQLTMVFPKLDVVAVTTARNYCSFEKMADDIAGAVKSDTPLLPNSASAQRLADEIRDIATEKPTAVGATPEIASEISGKTYTFPGNGVGVRSLSLNLMDPRPRYELEITTPDGSLHRLAGPLGLDGLYRKGEATPFGIVALKGTWSNDHSFVIDLRLIGGDRDRQWTLSFDGERCTLRGKSHDGRDISVDSEIAGRH